MKRRSAQPAVRPASGQVRIIGGRLRGSRLEVPALEGLRPTPDRVRETLFNWLMPHLPGARCLDLFAGSGALGFEAASRGAASVLMLEREPMLARSLAASAGRLGAVAASIVASDAIAWLRDAPAMPFDLVFVDPPFASDLYQPCFAQLPRWLAPQALIYVESARDRVPEVPAHWRLHRQGETRETRYALYRGRPTAPATLDSDSVT
jgi:16S rRNA (guanine966-N2)-methyltransferase